MIRARDAPAPRPAHHAPNRLGAGVIAPGLEAHDDEVQILHVVVLRGIDLLGGGERRLALAVERREVRLEHRHRVREPPRVRYSSSAAWAYCTSASFADPVRDSASIRVR